MFTYTINHPIPNNFNDFYNSLKTYKEGYEGHETFGRQVKQQNHNSEKGMRKNFSIEDLVGLSNERKSSGSPLFEEPNNRGFAKINSKLSFDNMDASTMASLSTNTSVSSFSSGLALNNAQFAKKNQNPNKKKKQNKKVKKGEPNYRIKYKTEVCKFWSERGYCDFGDACAFAHGDTEIRQKSHISSNYKTKKCVQFHELGYCPYGVRCQFIHCARNDAQLKPIIESATYEEEVENAEFWCAEDVDCMCLRRACKPRLSVFERLASGKSVSHDSEDNELLLNLMN